MDTIEKLEQLAQMKYFLNAYETTKATEKSILDNQMQELIDSVLTPEILAKVSEIKAEFQPKYDALENDETFLVKKQASESLTEEIKSEVVSLGHTVKGSVLMAVFAKGRVSWDTKALDGYVVAHPEVEQFRKVGEPSVSIRSV